MTTVRRAAAALAVMLFVALPAGADEKFDADNMRLFGGTYLADCRNPASASLSVLESSLVFVSGKKKVMGANVMSAASYYGDNTPPDYRTALLCELEGGAQMLFVVHQDAQGYFLTLDGDEVVKSKIGAAAWSLRYRKCDAAPAAPGKVVVAEAPAEEGPGAASMLDDPAFKAAYLRSLGKFGKVEWLTTLAGPGPPVAKQTVDGVEYTVVQACKDHDCADNNTTIFWDPAKKKVYGKIMSAGKSSLIGNPPPAVSKEIGAAWFKEWRQTPK